MTTESKNVEIAKMLGWVYVPWQEAQEKKLDAGWYSGTPIRQLAKFPSNFKCRNNNQLKFELDANWQYEALLFINQLSNDEVYNEYVIRDKQCCINTRNTQSGEVYNTIHLHSNTCKTTKEAVFEALYQFSQYLKNNKL